MNINKNLVLLGILISTALIIQNVTAPVQAYVLIWTTKTFILSFVSILTGVLIGYGLHGMMLTKNESQDNDDYEF